MIFGGYHYFETPDYDNCAGKVWYATKCSLLLTIPMSAYETIINLDQSKKALGGQFLKTNLPLLSAFVLGSSVSCAVANLRGQRDDNYNYIIGGFSTSAVWTAYYKSSLKGVGAGTIFALLGAGLKEVMKSDFVLWPELISTDVKVAGSSGFRDWGDVRIPGANWVDPGRRPGF